jgi:hypothetical protein
MDPLQDVHEWPPGDSQLGKLERNAAAMKHGSWPDR